MSTDRQEKTSARRSLPKRRPLQRILRAAAVVGALLIGIYATLPWWMPKGLLARKIAAQLSEELALPVTVGELELSWGQGVVVRDLRIGNLDGFAAENILTVETIRCDLSPIYLLWKGRLKWMELAGCNVNAELQEGSGADRLNLVALEALVNRPAPGRMVIRDASVAIQAARQAHHFQLNVADLQYTSGKLEGLGRVTLTASLSQNGGKAPITVMSNLNRPLSSVTADASFRFSNVDIAQLKLPALLGLPLERLAGVAAGQLDCEVSSSGEVKKFSLTLGVNQLDAQPLKGPKLPVIDAAEVAVGGRADPISGSIQANSFRVRLPGISLGGQGVVQVATLAGKWADIRSLKVEGTVNPAMVTALLAGEATALPGGVNIDGDVKVQASLAEHLRSRSAGGKGRRVSGKLQLDATAATVYVGKRVAKPPGRPLIAQFSGGVQEWIGRLNLQEAKLQLGANTFQGTGKLKSVRRLAGRLADRWDDYSLEMLLESLGALNWRGTCEIVELESLKDLLGEAVAAEAKLSGRIEGHLTLKHTDQIEFRCGLLAPAGTDLTVGRRFAKPKDKSVAISASGALATDQLRLSRFHLWAGVADAGLSVDDGRMILTCDPDTGGLDLRGGGQWSLRDAAALLACVPAAQDWPGSLAGGLSGRLDLALTGAGGRVHLDANATALQLALGEALTKQAGEPCTVTVDFRSDTALPPENRNRVSVRLVAGAADAAGHLLIPAGGGEIRCGGRVRVTDANWLLQRMPALGKALAGADVRGSMLASGELRLAADALEGNIICDGDDLQFRLPATGGSKQRGSALRLRLAAAAGGGEVTVRTLAMDVGQSSLSGEGVIRLAKTPAPPSAGKHWPPPGVDGIRGKLRAKLVGGEALQSLVPALGRKIERAHVTGLVLADAQLRGDADGLALTGAFDASRLAMRIGDDFRRQAGEPAAGTFRVTCDAGIKSLQVRDFVLATELGELRAAAAWPILAEGPQELRLALNVPDAARLGRNLPTLARRQLRGQAFAEARLQRTHGQTTCTRLNLTARKLAGLVGGLKCHLDGTVAVEQIDLDGGPATVERIATDGLAFAVGHSRGMVVADVSGVTEAPRGKVQLISENLDAHELQNWLAPPAKTATQPHLTESEEQALRSRARRVIKEARRRLARADLTVRARVDRLKHFDPSVLAFFDIRLVAAEITAKDGAVSIGYRAGLNGGEMNTSYRVDLKSTAAKVLVRNRIREVHTAENILAQLAKEFPGNTVFGTFSRDEDLTYWLEAAVMSLLDGRYMPVGVGSATTITSNGLVRGRAAPRFITRIFPGLNLTSYRYRRMTAFADYLADGSASNDMVYDGTNYDLYMVGTTDAERIGRYEIGLILLGTPQTAEFQHRFRQGRIPILKFKARIEGGRFHDEEVTYPWPTETAYKLFLKRNIVYLLWLDVRDRKPRGAIIHQPDSTPSEPRE